MSESTMCGDAAMRAYSATLPVPEFETTAFVPLDKPIATRHAACRAGRALMTARQNLKDQGAPFPLRFHMAPAHY